MDFTKDSIFVKFQSSSENKYTLPSRPTVLKIEMDLAS